MWRVRWKLNTLSTLALLWMEADALTRKAITRAAHNLDVSLRDKPEQKGESRPNDLRIIIEAPLGAMFRTDATKSTVEIVKLWSFKQKT